MKQELLEKVEKAREILKDFGKFKHLFSDDEGEKTLAELQQTVSQIVTLMKINELKDVGHPKTQPFQEGFMGHKIGSLVKIRPCDDKKTYLGFYLGELAKGSSISVSEDKIQLEWSGHNPAIFVPELGRIVMGYESWWGEIENEDQLKQISDDDIQNVWYVKLLKAMAENKKE